MAKQPKITISFSDQYLDVYKFLKTQPNISNYVCQNIRKYMAGDDLEAKVEHIVARILSGNSLVQKDPDDADPDLAQAIEYFKF